MLRALATLLVFQTIGEVLSYSLALPVPGPVLGMALLLALLLANERVVAALRPTCVELLKHLSLLFVPAGVGVMLHVGCRSSSRCSRAPRSQSSSPPW
jgi:holin-like protein